MIQNFVPHPGSPGSTTVSYGQLSAYLLLHIKDQKQLIPARLIGRQHASQSPH